MNFATVKNLKIVLSPLSWGMGHVSRCIPLIHRLQNQGNEIYIACDQKQQEIFSIYFPEVKFLHLDAYPFVFNGNGKFKSDIFKQSKALFQYIKKEHDQVEKWVKEYAFDLIISDHRYGFYSNSKPSIFITHQVQLPLKWYEFLAQKIHNRFLRRFSMLWILDVSSGKFSGKLSKNNSNFKAEYLGIVSRFEIPPAVVKTCDHLFIVSGPEPYAQLFTEEIESKLNQYAGQKVIVCSPAYAAKKGQKPGVTYIPSTDWKTIDAYFMGAKQIVSRAGYSTLMDAFFLKKRGTFSPTPGQAEQAYLAKFHQLKLF